MAIKENAQIVRKWLNDQEFHYTEKTFPDGIITFKLSMSSDSGIYDGYDVTLVCRDSDVQSLFHPPARLVEKAKTKILEFFTWINYRFRLGKFTVDLRDGEIRWETVKGAAELKADVNDAMDDLIGFPNFVLDKFAPGLAAIVLGMKDAKQAFDDCDKDPEEVPQPEPPPEDPPEGDVEKKSKKRGRARRPGAPQSQKDADSSEGEYSTYNRI